MKYFRKIVWVVLVVNIVLVAYVLTQFTVDDMTLSKGEVYAFNEGWTLTRQDGNSIVIEELPYLGESEPQEHVVMSNTIPKEYWGMTMSFLSADKVLRVTVDGSCVYEFGVSDQRSFGQTPGSVVNFIDIPADLSTGDIRIEMVSPYADYAAKINEITIGKRDVLILKLLSDNGFHIGLSFAIVVCGVGFALLFLIRKVSKQDTGGVQYLCGYCIVSAIYYFIETKTAHIFYGNQTLYSVLVFLCLMFMPLWLMLYYGHGVLGIYKKRWLILSGLICVNIFLQFVLQVFGILDFMEMAFVSHVMLSLVILVTGLTYLDICRQKRWKEIGAEMMAWFFMTTGGLVDIMRMYAIGVGDMGKFSRLGATAFCAIMLYKHFKQIMAGYSKSIEENARLLEREMAYIEKKNAQLEQANALAEEARKEALAADDAKGKFLAHMSHEIRTPINAVLGMNTMILRETTDMQIKEYALDIQNAGHSLLALINDILDFSKIESGKLEIICVEYDLSSMIHDISNMILAKVEDKKLAFQIHVDENLPSKLLGDDVRIRQILVNLLNNAVKYTHEGSVSLGINGRKEAGKVILDFEVRDTGIGIKEEDISKLFKEFERIEEKRNRNIEGTGLGINITMQLLELMGSSLNVASEYGKGSCFSFSLEQQIVDSTPVGNLDERIKAQSDQYSYMEVFTAPDARLLVVDDNATNLKVFVSLLKTTKVQVDVADGGRACLDMICQKRYDLIFLDHMMPDMDGIETLHCMKKLEYSLCQETPVIALTANAITGAKEMYLAEGFDAFLSKPINPEKLEQMILLMLPRELLVFDVVDDEVDGEEQKIKDSFLAGTESGGLPDIDGVDWKYGLMHLKDEELLLATVKDFYRTIDSEADCLEHFYHEIDSDEDALRQYRIKVHAMKSSAALFGAIPLSGVARLLEYAARDGRRDVICGVTPVFLEEWRGYKEKLKVCMPKEELRPIEETSVIVELLKRLRDAMEELDIDVADVAMEELRQYEFPNQMQKSIEKLGTAVVNLDSTSAAKLTEELLIQIVER